MKVLIIDDEAHIRQMMRLTLEPAGYVVDEAASGEEGLARFGDGREYAAVLLDQKMPGLDGLVTLQRLREHDAGARVIIATAFASIELAVDAMRLGAVDFLRKPMTPETLRAAVAAALTGRAGPSAARRSTDQASPLTNEPQIQILTLNGFQILQPEGAPDAASFDHAFRVRHPSEPEVTVIVALDPAIFERVERLSHRRRQPGGAFWRQQSERLLSAYLWSEGKPPLDGRLRVTDVSRDDIERATADEGD